MARSPIPTVLLVGTLLGCAPLALGQDAPSGNPLAGPEVSPIERLSLAGDSMMGMEEQGLLDRPEIAAVALLDLDADQSQRVNAVVLEHTSTVDRVFRDHVLEIQQWVNDLKTGSRQERFAAVTAMREAFAPVLEAGPLDDRIAAALPSQEASRYAKLIAEYEAGLEEQARLKAEAAGQRFTPMRHRAQRQLAKVGQDIRAAYERTLLADQQQFDTFLASAQLSPEGEAAVRAGVRKLNEDSGFDASPEQRRMAFIEVARQLEAEDRARLLRAVSRAR